MAAADEAVEAEAEDGDRGAGGCGGGGLAASDGEEERDGEDLLERDTRLSRASNPWVAGPRLRNS